MKLLSNLFRVALLTLCSVFTLFAADTVNTGAKVSFYATADGTEPITYEWFRNGVKIGEGTPFVINSIQTSDAGTYFARATNVAGSADSQTLELIVVESSPPIFALQPSGQTVIPGASVTFTSLANGLPAPTYQWYRDGVPVEGATSPNLTINSATADSVGNYTVVASNRLANTLSQTATLQLYSLPVFATHPASQSVNVGTNVSFTADASGNPTPTYQWYFNGESIAGKTTNRLDIDLVTVANAGEYYVVATNQFGGSDQINSVRSNTATLTVNAIPPVIAEHPVNQSIKVGSPVTFAVVATGSSPNYQWQKNGNNIVGATGAIYTIPSVASGDAASYRVVVSNAAGTVVSNAAVLTVLYPPIFIQQPKTTIIVAMGSPLLIESLASGWPTPTYAWMKNSAPVEGAVEPNLYIARTLSTDGGTYFVKAANTEGITNSSPSLVTVTTSPVIVTKPANQVVKKFQTATFTVVASGSSPLRYQWRKGNNILNGQTSSTLTITNANNPDAGTYTVTVSNSLGTASASATLVVTNK